MVRPSGTAPAARRVAELPEPTWRLLIGRGLPQFAGEAVVPVVVFYACWRTFGLIPAVVASSAVSLVLAAWLVRRRRGVGLVAIGATFVIIQAVVAVAAHSATVYFAQPVVLSALWAVAYFVSAAIGRPLIGVFASAWYPFPPWFRASAPYRREFGLQSVVWGVYCLVRAGLRLFVLLRTGVGAFVLVSIATGTPALVVLVGWGLWHARRTFARLDAADAGA
jgi:Protein of unknown function (DUF3159)